MVDKLESFGHSLVQHGHHNERVYLMKLADEDPPEIVSRLIDFAKEKGYGKIFAKIKRSRQLPFLEAGFAQEGRIPRFYSGQLDAVFLGFYLDPSRQQEAQPELVDEVLALAERKAHVEEYVPLPAGLTCRIAEPRDAAEMASVYRQVFASYPFPIDDPAYLCRTMAENLIYFGVWQGDRLIALSSTEMDRENANAEMTDFATLPECRGQGIAQHLLQEMEVEMSRLKIQTLYTIARAYSHGMNLTFSKNGYQFSGTLTSNTNIFGSLESMNIWYKNLS